jgi:hypothetical protein
MGTDPVLTHRLDYWAWVEQYADPRMRDTLLSLRDHWHEVNTTHFESAMTLPYITLTEPSKPSLYGQCCSVSSWGSRLEIRLRPSLLSGTHPDMAPGEAFAAGRFRFVADVLTHEAIHQYDMEIAGQAQDSYHGHGPLFTETANGIGAKLGVGPVVPRNRKGSMLAIASRWPHCVRDPGFYLGAYRVPSKGDAPATTRCPCCDGTGRLPLTSPALLRLAIAEDEPGYARLADVVAESVFPISAGES